MTSGMGSALAFFTVVGPITRPSAISRRLYRCLSHARRVPSPNVMVFSDLALSRRLERAEAHECVQFAEARRRLFPESGAEWMECAGTYAIFDGVDSPVTQSFGLGLFEQL